MRCGASGISTVTTNTVLVSTSRSWFNWRDGRWVTACGHTEQVYLENLKQCLKELGLCDLVQPGDLCN